MNIGENPAGYDRLPEILLEELNDIGVFLMDRDCRITSWSPGIESILGYSEKDFIGRDAREIFTPEDRELHEDDAEFERARKEGRSPDMRWHLKKNGSRIFIDGIMMAVSAVDGTHIGYTKIIRDTRPNRLSAGMLQAILERTPDVIYMNDRVGRFTFVNSEAARLFGRDIEEIIGHSPDEFLPPHISGPLRKNDESIIEQNSANVLEERLFTKEHGERTFLSGKAPWSDGNGNVIGIVSISQDISDRKAAEEERERLVQQLRRSNENLAEFSHVVSHDLQAPLRAINGYAQLLAKRYRGKLDSTADEFISFILQGAGSMDELIKSLLQYAEAGDENLTRTAVRLDAVLDGVQSNLQTLIRDSSAELAYGFLPTVVGDPVQLLQLFQNLIGNAIKYARAGVAPRIEISAEKSGPAEYRFAIKDNGMGIEEKDFERVFAPLKRLHGHEIPGSGIGLAICKKIVERHGGQIWLTSQVGKGSTFYFTLAKE